MDMNIRKRKFKDTEEKEELSRKEVNLTRTLSLGKRVKLSPDGEANTSRESENSFADEAAHETMITYYAQRSIAENIQKKEFYSIVKDKHLKSFYEFLNKFGEIIHHTRYEDISVIQEEFQDYVQEYKRINEENNKHSKDFYKFLDRFGEIIHHPCYADISVRKGVFQDYVQEYKRINEEIKKEIDNYELNPIVRLERKVEKLENSDANLEKQEENIIDCKEKNKLEMMDDVFSFLMERGMGKKIPLQHNYSRDKIYEGRSKQQEKEQNLKKEEYIQEERKARKIKLIIDYAQKIEQKLKVLPGLIPEAQKLARDAKELSDDIESLLKIHRDQWDSMVEQLRLQREGALERLELPKQIVSPDMVKKLEDLQQKVSYIQDKWENREKQYQEKSIEGNNRLWNYVNENILKISLDKMNKMKQFNATFEEIKIRKMGYLVDFSEVPNLINRAEDIKNDIKFRIRLLDKNEKYKDSIIKESERIIGNFIANARYFGFS